MKSTNSSSNIREHPKNGYTFSELILIMRTNLFWKWVDFFSYKMKKFAKLYEKLISKEYEREGKIFDIEESESILHIGCGSYPITAITLSRLNGGKIVAVDRNVKSVERAKKIILEKNLDDRIHIEVGDGLNYPVKKFDTIIVSGCSFPKHKILQHLIENTSSDSKIIIREQYKLSDYIKSCIKCYDNVEIVNEINNYPIKATKWQSFFILKK
jgi:precorrin-6B methylase 2